MTNWRTYSIQKVWHSDVNFIVLTLDGYVDFSNSRLNSIYCEKCSPFSDWKVGYQIDIDLDRIKYIGVHEVIGNTTIVKLSQTSVSLARDNNMLDSMRRRVEEVGDVSLEIIDERGTRPDGTYYHTQGWRYSRK